MPLFDSNSDDRNWWTFSLLPPGESMPEEVNTVTADDRRQLTYQSYLQLDKILSAQRPSSTSTDERPFIIVHQWFELCFKLMIFDLSVIYEMFHHLEGIEDDAMFAQHCLYDAEGRWDSVRTSTSRLVHCAKALLPKFFATIMGDAGSNEAAKRNAHFRSEEFKTRFRDNLPPASGFQSEQFRILQIIFGKAAMFKLKYFDAHTFHWNYGGRADAHDLVAVIAPIIFGKHGEPEQVTEFWRSSPLERVIYAVLTRLQRLWNIEGDASLIMAPRAAGLWNVRKAFIEMASSRHDFKTSCDLARTFMKDLTALQRDEICDARAKFAGCSEVLAQINAKGGYAFAETIYELKATDSRFLSFLKTHTGVAKAAGLPDEDQGSAGGGMRFLNLSLALTEMFPFLRALPNEKAAAIAAAW